MTLYIVKHETGNVKLHDQDGTELFDVYDDIQSSDSPERDLIEAYVNANPNADLLADGVRPYFVELTSGNWVYRDLTATNESVPWQ